jgi:predicted ArsR family transcriptional regulator
MGAGHRQVSDEEILRLFAVSPDPIVTAKELAHNLPISQQAVNKRLGQLEGEGLITSRKVGASAVVYWLTEEGRRTLSKAEYQQLESEDSQ